MLEKFTDQTMSSREIAALTGESHEEIIAKCEEMERAYYKLGMDPITESGSVTTIKGIRIVSRTFHLTKMQAFDIITGYDTENRIRLNRRIQELMDSNSKTYSDCLRELADQIESVEAVSWQNELKDIIAEIGPIKRIRKYKTYIAYDGSFYKIGRAVDPEKRLMLLLNANPGIRLLHIIEADVEKKLHTKYKSKKIKGEWFDLGPNELKEIIEMKERYSVES